MSDLEKPTVEQLEEALIQLYRYMPNREWNRALPESIRNAKKLAETVITRQRKEKGLPPLE